MFVRSWVWAWRFHEDWLNFPRPTVRKIQQMAYIEHCVTNPRLGDLAREIMNMRRTRAFQVPVKDLSLFRTGWTREGPAEFVDGDLV